MPADGDVARRYHDLTCHTEFSVHTSGHYLDFRIQPLPFKIYEDLEAIPLQPHFAPLEAPLDGTSPLTLTDLARVLFYSAGITRKHVFPGGDVLHFRAAACTGALYQIDLHVACGDLGGGVEAGLYHFSPHDFGLRRMRPGDWRPAVAAACAHDVTAEVYIICGATYWRNAWKYQARAYRHFGWDNGTLLANLVAVAPGARVDVGFVDAPLNRLLGLDIDREVVFSVASMGSINEAPAPVDPPPWSARTRPLSDEEVDYPLMREMHAASMLDKADEVRAWRAARLTAADAPPAPALRLPSPISPQRSLHETIVKRGSSRRFARAPIAADQLSALLEAAAARPALDVPAPLCQVYVIVNAVEGVESGAYVFAEGLHLLKAGNFRPDAAWLDLGQELAGDAAVNIYFMADLEAVLQALGDRGYRAVQLEAGMRGGAVYLAAYSRAFGATGLTFYDEDVTRFFSPPAAALSPIFLMAAGHAQRSR